MSSIHDSYSTQRKGEQSKHFFIRLCDLLFCRMDWKKNEYISTNILIWFWSTHWFWVIPLMPVLPHWFCMMCHLTILLPFFQLPLIYRHFRHKYLKKHNLPGPYGWGTIDAQHSGCYQTEEIFTL